MSSDAEQFQGDYFEDRTFERLELQSADLSGKEFFRCTFLHCHLQESRWREAKLEDCVFRGCDLTRAQWLHAALREVRFESSKLMGIDWSPVSPNPELAFEECNLRYASFAGLSLRKTIFDRCTALEANFLDSDLSDSEFPGTDLSGANIRDCTLTRTDFSTAIGLFLDPARNRLKQTRVPLESAVLLAQSLGMIVAGHSPERTQSPHEESAKRSPGSRGSRG